MIEIIDNFLPEEEFKSIQSFMMGGEFRWFYCKGRTTNDDGSFHMSHIFFQPDVGPNSEHLDMWNTFMNKVEAKKCERIKVNLTFKTTTIELGEYHSDYSDMKTATFYINTNNGYTEFESGVRVSSVANRVCIFDSNLKHRGTTHTEGDQQRIVVNFNYA
jgi:hypothetical protein|tara:strand:- start:52 stop:531 length:480 start_codon:yes stop_codon:yes gene_type:complete